MRRAPDPPPHFRGRFLSEPDRTAPYAEASGPIRIRPAAVAQPSGIDDIVALVAWAHREGVPLVPRGGATGMPGGNVGPGVIVDMTGWRQIGPVDRDAGTVRVGPGAVAATVAEHAHGAGWWLPALPSSAERCTAGGMLANNAAGARSFRHGTMRDRVVEAGVVMADGSCATLRRGYAGHPSFSRLAERLRRTIGSSMSAWPRVRKNSSGYALDRFLAEGHGLDLLPASEGTLAIVTHMVLQLEAPPHERALALVGVPEPAAVDEVVRSAKDAGASACEFFAPSFVKIAGLRNRPELAPLLPEGGGLMLIEVEGNRDSVESALRNLETGARRSGWLFRSTSDPRDQETWWAIRHAASPVIAREAERGRVSIQFIEDSVVPPGRLGEYLTRLGLILAEENTEAAIFGHAGDGNLHVNPLLDVRDEAWPERVRRILHATAMLVADLGGTLSGEHGDGRVRAPLLSLVWPEPFPAAFEEVKRFLDPATILNPGVVVPLAGQDPLEGLLTPVTEMHR